MDKDRGIPKSLNDALTLAKQKSAEGGSDSDLAIQFENLLSDAVAELGRGLIRRRGRNAAGVEYVVERLGGIETLAEHRLSGSANALRCPKDLYDRVAAAIAASDKPVSVKRITDAVGVPEKDYRVRVAIRCWLTTDPAILVRATAQYRPADPASFASSTRALWESLRRTGK